MINKQKSMSWVVAICTYLFAGFIQAELIAYDNFNYTLGTTIAAGGELGSETNGFVNTWFFSDITGEVVNNLTYSGVESSGNALSINGTGGYLFRGMEASLPKGTYYISYLFYRSAAEGWNLQLKHASTLASGPTSSTKVLATFDAVPAGRARLKTGGSGTVGVADAPYFTFGTTNLALIKLVITDTDTTASMNIYNAGAVIDTSSWAMTSSDSVTGGSGWRLTNAGTGSYPLIIDEFRVGTELSDVIPSPRGLSLFLVY